MMYLNGLTAHLNILVNRQINSSYKKIEILISFLLSSSIYMAVNGFLKAYYSFLLFGAVINWSLLLATFLSVFAVYCMNRLTDKEEDTVNSPERASFVNGNEKKISIVLLFSYITAIILGISQSIYAILILLFPLFAGIAYNIKLSPIIPRLKDVLGVKNIITALSWAVGTTFLPLIGLNNVSLIFICSLFYFFFVKSFINTVLYDIRDINGDKKNGIITIPVKIGKENTKKLLLTAASSLLVMSFLLLLINQISFGLFLTMVFCVFNAYWYIGYTCNNNEIHKYKMPLLINGEWFFVLGLYYLIPLV